MVKVNIKELQQRVEKCVICSKVVKKLIQTCGSSKCQKEKNRLVDLEWMKNPENKKRRLKYQREYGATYRKL